jgi:CubicO group peptidase (beta-lactamase class C family)
MRLALMMAAALMATTVPAAARQPVPADAASKAKLRQAGAEVLFWSQAQRDANFRQMEQLFPTVTIKAGGKVRALPQGRPLTVPAADIDRYIADQNIAGLIVLRDGKIRLERYARGFGPAGRWTSFSVAKSLTSTLFGAAVKDGKLKLSDPVTRFIPEMKGSAYDGVTVQQVLTMSSGARWNENYADPKSDVAQMFSRPTAPNEDAIVGYMRTLGRAAAPGTKFNYNTGETNLAGTILSRAVGMPISRYASLKVWRPAGMEADAYWQVDERGREIAGCCVSMRLRDYARLGQLTLENGNGLLARGWVKDATSIHQRFEQPGWGYGYFWWVQPGGYRASGIFGQQIWMDPARKVVIVTVAAWPKAVDDKMAADRQAFFRRLADAAVK